MVRHVPRDRTTIEEITSLFGRPRPSVRHSWLKCGLIPRPQVAHNKQVGVKWRTDWTLLGSGPQR